MKGFTDNMLEIIVKPELEYDKKESVQITHDECHFYANDRQCRIWTQEDENVLRSKHIVHSVIVSAFVYPCHRLLKLSEEQFKTNSHIKHKESFVICSVQEDRYWKSEHILEQYIDEYEEKHDQKMVFLNNYPVKKLRGEPKGIQQVLEEYNIWPVEGVNLVCDHCSGKIKDDIEELNCCA
ncbi:hypothetical protein F8M41_014310 [Gigaspora margarita]|uniref:Uncharacterized protein n=1 Tax=Gigaspora margarita TaxID=4874 RepID=A0A8H3ZZY4_GIGMA|nr:hypothetical protein F8M41_014310 [Gigaspora margarita]